MSATDLFFLTVEDVLSIHDEQLRTYGGSEGMRDQNVLESAVATPQASFGRDHLHDDVFLMAAAYAFHIAENQPSWCGLDSPTIWRCWKLNGSRRQSG